jgi:serine/threonine protein kinase
MADCPDVEQLNDLCLECQNCHAILALPELEPLTIVRCPECAFSFFVPYRVKDYWLYKPLGGGGMGSVYKAVSATDPEAIFAVKILPRKRRDDPSLIDALLKEAEVGAKFGDHPHLAKIEEYGECDGEYFSAMAFMEGQRLDQLIESQETIDHKFVLLWALQILSAEQRIYECGYLYRDLKPQNIIIDGDGNAHLFDYGLALEYEVAEFGNAADSIEGSPLYMPPERITGEPENMSSEIYSLGMVMFHALARKTFYTATGAYELAKKHVMSLRLAGVSNRLPSNVHPRISEIIDIMIARLPSDRYQTYKEVALDIQEVYEQT